MITTGNPTLAQWEGALSRVVGTRGTAAMLARSRQQCGDAAAEDEALVPHLQRLCTELLGARLAARLLPGARRH